MPDLPPVLASLRCIHAPPIGHPPGDYAVAFHTPRGFCQYLDPHHDLTPHRLDGRYEPKGRDFARRWFTAHPKTPGLAFLDVGAYCGDYTLEAAAAGLAAPSIVAIEPQPFAARCLAASLALNGCGAEIINRPAWNGPAHLANTDGHHGGFTLRPADEPAPAIAEPLKLDDLAGRLRPDCPCLVKIDTEGAELEILQGARGLLRRLPPNSALLVEMHRRPDRHPNEAGALLWQAGYRRQNHRHDPPRNEPRKMPDATQLTLWTRRPSPNI